MIQLYDVIIIGAGPAGTSCAYNLKRKNPKLRVLLVDKAKFPRYKPCGGGVSPEVTQYLDYDLSPAINYVCHEVVMVTQGKHITSTQYPLWMVRREQFDHFLLSKAQALGVEFIHSCEVRDVIQTAVGTTVITPIGEFTATVIVLAEGGRGKLAKYLRFPCKTKIFAAMEYEHYTQELIGKLYIDFDYNDNGYAWNFPKMDGLSLGIGGFIKGRSLGKVGLPQKLKEYSRQFRVQELEKPYLHGHPIQLYAGHTSLVRGNILLIGEIAGCVDPLTAEGIRPAIKSGYLAASIIDQALAEQKLSILKKYEKVFHKQIGRDFQYARIISYFLNKNLSRVLPMFANEKAINGFMSVFSGHTTYRDKINLHRIAQLLWKKYNKLSFPV